MSADALTNKLAQVIGQLQDATPKATAVALEATRADALATIAQGVVLLAVLLIAVWVLRCRFMPWARTALEADGLAMSPFVYGVALGSVILICAISVIATLFDPWTYIALAHPDLWIAHQIINAAAH